MMGVVSPSKEPKPVDPGVLGGLSRTRPQRRSTRRTPRDAEAARAPDPLVAKDEAAPVVSSDAPVADAVKAARKAAKGGGKAAKGGSKAKASSAKAASKTKASGSKAKAASAKPSPQPKAKAAPAKPSPRPKSAAAAKAAPSPEPAPAEPTSKPEKLPPAGYATPEREQQPSGTELVATALQAAGEVGRLGQAAVRGLLSRLPKP